MLFGARHARSGPHQKRPSQAQVQVPFNRSGQRGFRYPMHYHIYNKISGLSNVRPLRLSHGFEIVCCAHSTAFVRTDRALRSSEQRSIRMLKVVNAAASERARSRALGHEVSSRGRQTLALSTMQTKWQLARQILQKTHSPRILNGRKQVTSSTMPSCFLWSPSNCGISEITKRKLTIERRGARLVLYNEW